MDPAKRKALGRKPPKRGKSKQVNRTLSFLKRQRGWPWPFILSPYHRIFIGDRTWLETHIWHAKRMHMKNVWGYRLVRWLFDYFVNLAGNLTQLIVRDSHRKILSTIPSFCNPFFDSSRCIIYINYLRLRETVLIGEDAYLLLRLSGCWPWCCKACNHDNFFIHRLTRSHRYTLGSRIHETHLYTPGSFPFGLIAPVTIIWKSLSVMTPEDIPNTADVPAGDAQPKSKKGRRGKRKEKEISIEPVAKPGPDAHRTLWIRFHPSTWQEVWDAVRKSASIVLNGVHQERKERVAQAGLDVVHEVSNGEGKSLEVEESIDLVDLRSHINCFELMGPRSSQVIRGTMTMINGDDRPIFHQVRHSCRLDSIPDVHVRLLLSFGDS